jgi:Pyruvate/2-oxoacid:ferredoxin oxidoreductase delta subunit
LLIISIASVLIAVEKADMQKLSGKVTLKKDQYILQSGKDKLVLALLPKPALDSLAFNPQNNDTLEVFGYRKNNAFVCLNAVWKGNTYTFVDSLGNPAIAGTSTWKVTDSGCISCKLCTVFCPVGAIKMQKTATGIKAVIDQTKCVGCNICIDGNGDRFMGCPTRAISK